MNPLELMAYFSNQKPLITTGIDAEIIDFDNTIFVRALSGNITRQSPEIESIQYNGNTYSII
jgi:hypothetical protein